MGDKTIPRLRARSISRRHKNLGSQQTRLRHLTCVFGRNIDPSLVPSAKQSTKPALLSLYFTLHSIDSNMVLYRSEVIENSLNPNWQEFDSGQFAEGSNTAATSCVVCVWGDKGDGYRLIIKWNVEFSGLKFLREQQRRASEDQKYELNSLVFGMFDAYYTVPKENLDKVEPSNDGIMKTLLKVGQDSVRWTYKKSSLLRVHCMIKAVHETRQQVREAKRTIETKFQEKSRRNRKLVERESLIRRISMLKEELGIQKDTFSYESSSYKLKNDVLKQWVEESRRRQEYLEEYISDLKVSHSLHIENRETLVKVNAHLTYRRKQLAAELSYIFPTVEIPPKEYGKREFAICGVRLPNSDELTGEDDEMLSVGFGNTCHLVNMLARFMELPLRYPLRPMGSRSSIFDLVTDRLLDKEREFPLFLKGKEKYQFHYGVFLLNKNIAQLRYHCGYGTSDLRNTLLNLKHLLEAKYGVKVVIKLEPEPLPHGFAHPVGPRKQPSVGTDLSTSPGGIHLSIDKDSKDGLPNDYTNDEENSDLNSKRNTLPFSSAGSNPGLKSSQNQTQMHRFIARKSSKKSLSRTRSAPPDSPNSNSSDILLEIPFEDIVRGAYHSKSGSTKQLKRNLDFSKEQPIVPTTEEETEAQQIPVGNGEDFTDNGQNYGSYVDVGDVHLEQRKQPPKAPTKQLNRQFSDMLVIPGPFDEVQTKFSSST